MTAIVERVKRTIGWRGAGRHQPRYLRWNRHWVDLKYVLQVLLALVESNLPLADGLEASGEDAPNRKIRRVLDDLATDIRGGNSVSRALGSQRGFFPPYCIEMLRAGEVSGSLQDALEHLCASLEARQELRDRFAFNGYYLLQTVICELILIVGIAVYVMPQFQGFFSSMGVTPRLPMRIASAFSGDIWLFGWVLAIPIVWIALEFSALRQGFLYQVMLFVNGYLPLVSRSHRRKHLGEACLMTAMLLRAGISLPDALRSSAEGCLSHRCRRSLHRIVEFLEAGESLQDAMEAERRILPRSMRSLLQFAVLSGNLPEGFRQVAVLFQGTARRWTSLLMELGAPVLICAIGAVVFSYYLATFLTLIDMTMTVVR